MPKDPVLLSLGHGYSAQALAKRLHAHDWRIYGTTRSQEKLAQIAGPNTQAILWPGTDLRPVIDQADHLLISAGPTQAGCPVLGTLGDVILARAENLRWVGYLSTTGVYGDRAGGWVDETSPCHPTTQRGQWRLAAEEGWRGLAERGVPVHIFRLAGIYGPGRGPFAKVRAGTARRIIKPGQVFSRIHVEDIATCLYASINRPAPGAIYNLCDDEAAPPEDVIAHAAELLGLPLPPAIDLDRADLGPMAKSFYAESKRVSNARIKRDLGVRLRYASYREGLAALLAGEKSAAASGT